MGGLSNRLLALFLVAGGLACGIKKPASTGSIHPGVMDDGGLGGGGEGAGGLGGIPAAGSGGVGTGSGGTVGNGGKAGTGSAVGSGGVTASGGVTSSGGGVASGGRVGTGGSVAGSGGALGTGDTVGSTGGVTGTGATGSGTGGALGTGGAVAGSGGALGTGGAVASTGGVSATGGATPPGEGTCETPIAIPMDTSQADLVVDTAGHAHVLDVPCATTGNVVVLSFTLNQRELVYADTFGASWNTVLSFGDDCDGASGVLASPGTTACNDDACGTQQSQAVALMGYGRHYLFVTGTPNQSGQVTVHFQHAQAGGGSVALLPAGIGTLQGMTSGTGTVSLCEASAPENSYWWSSCSTYQGGVLAASTCSGTAFDTVLSLQVPKAGTLNCADDDPTCGVGSKMSVVIPKGAGVHVLTVDGGTGSAKGAYTLTYQRP